MQKWILLMLLFMAGSTWQRINWDGKFCYVNGYYTDSRCTVGMSLLAKHTHYLYRRVHED